MRGTKAPPELPAPMPPKTPTPPPPTLQAIIKDLERWKKKHKPYDKLPRLSWFRFTIGADRQGILVRRKMIAGMPKRLFLTRHALNQLLNTLGYTMGLYKRLPNQLNVRNINHLLQHRDYARKKYRLRIIDRNIVRAVLSEKYRPFDNLELLKMLVPILGTVLVSWYFNDEIMIHAYLLARRRLLFKPGDPVRRGLHLSNSEVGARSVTVTSYVHRESSDNGFIGTRVFRFKHVGTIRGLRNRILRAFARAKTGDDEIIGSLRNAQKEVIKNPRAFINKLAKTRRLNRKQVWATLRALPGKADKPTSKFELSQALAKAANSFDGDAAYKLRQAAVYAL
ncbi:MAG: hypothetical protein PVJ61_04800 [Dehalococcoidia bacterium]